MLEVAGRSWPAAARPGARGVPDLGQVPQQHPGIMPPGLVPVIAAAGGDRPDPQEQVPPHGHPGGQPPGPRLGAVPGRPGRRSPSPRPTVPPGSGGPCARGAAWPSSGWPPSRPGRSRPAARPGLATRPGPAQHHRLHGAGLGRVQQRGGAGDDGGLVPAEDPGAERRPGAGQVGFQGTCAAVAQNNGYPRGCRIRARRSCAPSCRCLRARRCGSGVRTFAA